MAGSAFTFGPGGAYTATWDGVETLTVTLTSGGAFVASFSGQSLAGIVSLPAFIALLSETSGQPLPQMLQAATPAAGYAKVNGTGTIISWTAPADGALHQFSAVVVEHAAALETGGAVQVSWTAPDGTATTTSVFAGSQNGIQSFSQQKLCQAGTAVIVQQNSALTAGGPTQLWAQLWGA